LNYILFLNRIKEDYKYENDEYILALIDILKTKDEKLIFFHYKNIPNYAQNQEYNCIRQDFQACLKTFNFQYYQDYFVSEW